MPTDVLVSPDEYLARERASERKHEYRDGEIIPMSGASRHHVRIVTNVIFELERQLRDGDCFVFSTDLRVRVHDAEAGEDLFTYPDIGVTHEEPQFLDDQFDTLLNPALLLEVLSTSTRDYDRGDKFARYRTIDALRDYVLIDQERPHAEHFARQGGGRWVLEETSDPEATLMLSSIGAELALAEVYHKIEWAA